MTTTATSTAYWSNCKPDDADSQRYCQRNRDDLNYWITKLPEDEDTLTLAIALIATRTGLSKHMTQRAFQGAAIMQLLPHLRTQVLDWGHLEMRYLAAIDDCLTGVAEEQLSDFDAALTWYFTPEFQDQTLPTINQMKAFIEKLKLKHCPGYGSEEKFIFKHLTIRPGNDGMADVFGLVTKEEGTLINTALDKTAKKYDINRVEALIKILTEKVNVHATLNYWTHDPKEPPSYLDGAGMLIAPPKIFYNLPVKYQDLSGIEHEESHQYRPTEKLKTAVRLRDGVCRFPDCDKPAAECEIDHVVEHGKNGGLTVLSNLQCLCKHHHDLKTLGDLTIFMNHFGVCYWHMPNGSVRVTTPQGPEAHYPKASWLRTWKTYRARPKTTAEAEQKTETPTAPTPPNPTPPANPTPKRKLLALPPAPIRLALPPGPPKKRKRKPPTKDLSDQKLPPGFFNQDENTPAWVKDIQDEVKKDIEAKKKPRIKEDPEDIPPF